MVNLLFTLDRQQTFTKNEYHFEKFKTKIYLFLNKVCIPCILGVSFNNFNYST